MPVLVLGQPWKVPLCSVAFLRLTRCDVIKTQILPSKLYTGSRDTNIWSLVKAEPGWVN